MRVLYIGANLRMSLSVNAAQAIRGFGLKQGLEQWGAEVIPLMAGDQLNAESTRSFYSKWLKRFLPHSIAAPLRDTYEIVLDDKLYRIVEPRVREIKPNIIVQQHARYGRVGIRLSQKYKIPIYLDDITPVWEGEVINDRSLKPIARQIRKNVFSNAAGLIAVSREMVQQLKSEGVPENKIYFVPNGVDCRLFDPDRISDDVRQELGLINKIVVGYVGIFAQYHRIDLLIQAAYRVIQTIPQIHFLLVGNYRDGKMIDLARANGLEKYFTFTGTVSHLQVPSYLKAMDFCVVPATLPYMSPMKIYEYMAMRKPVIAPTDNSISETLVNQSQNGFLFKAGDEESLAEAITMLALKPEIVQEMGVAARRFVEENFTWYHQTKGLFNSFETAQMKWDIRQ